MNRHDFIEAGGGRRLASAGANRADRNENVWKKSKRVNQPPGGVDRLTRSTFL
jgi:hypothetical protein